MKSAEITPTDRQLASIVYEIKARCPIHGLGDEAHAQINLLFIV